MKKVVTAPSSIIPRRSVLAMMGAAPVAAALGGLGVAGPAQAAGALNIYSWPDYFAQDDLNAWTKKSGITPNISTYNADEVMFAKMNSPAGTGFDVVVPSSGWIKLLGEKWLIQPLDHFVVALAKGADDTAAAARQRLTRSPFRP